jgi:UDPglucose 6-dehydrogenase
MNNIIIKGRGYVGKSTARFLDFHGEFDSTEFDDPPLGIHAQNFDQASWCVIAVPSPQTDSGINDDGYVLDAVRDSERQGFTGTYLVRSTLALSSIDKLEAILGDRLIVWPEFIRAAHWEQDAVDPELIVLGGPRSNMFASHFGLLPRTLIFTVMPKEAMAMKLAANTFLAQKVVFANQLRELCEYYDVDYKNVASVLRSDTRLGSTHWDSPGPDGAMGFGGHCFPKDSMTYKSELQNAGIDATMLEAMIQINQRLRNV